MRTALYSMNFWGLAYESGSYGGNAVEIFRFTGFISRPGYCCLESGCLRLPESLRAMTNILLNSLPLAV